MKYPKERKEAILKKTPPPQSIAEIAKEEGICEATLYHWRQAARAEGRLLPDGDSTPSGWTEADKRQVCRGRGDGRPERSRALGLLPTTWSLP
jgi:transposase-like protein